MNINRLFRHTAVLLSVVFLLCGCGAKEYAYTYETATSVSCFQIVSDVAANTSDTFAGNLCVVSDNVTKGTDVDMSRASAAGLFDINAGKVIYAKNVHEKLYPASLTKIMTALVALKYGNLDDTITVSQTAAGITEKGAQLCGLKTGDTLTLDQALHALLMYSANDAGVAIAEHIGGSVEGFADMMNKEALELGATNSHFVNPHGLQDDNHYVTAYDLYLIFNEVMKYNRFVEIISMDSYNSTYTDRKGNAKTLDFGTTNLFLQGNYTPPENVTVIGGKTGTTSAAGNCLILLSKDSSGNPYISVILRSEERTILYEEMTGLLAEIHK